VNDNRPPLPSPLYRLTRDGGAVCRVCNHRIRKVCALAYAAHRKSYKHQLNLHRFREDKGT
jgi:hypothetical protein